MTETARRAGTAAANQAGARINLDAYAQAGDCLPLEGIDPVELGVGNARQAPTHHRALRGRSPAPVDGPGLGGWRWISGSGRAGNSGLCAASLSALSV